jgi:hypothetical protein
LCEIVQELPEALTLRFLNLIDLLEHGADMIDLLVRIRGLGVHLHTFLMAIPFGTFPPIYF